MKTDQCVFVFPTETMFNANPPIFSFHYEIELTIKQKTRYQTILVLCPMITKQYTTTTKPKA